MTRRDPKRLFLFWRFGIVKFWNPTAVTPRTEMNAPTITLPMCPNCRNLYG